MAAVAQSSLHICTFLSIVGYAALHARISTCHMLWDWTTAATFIAAVFDHVPPMLC
jgi:hypothetical protein